MIQVKGIGGSGRLPETVADPFCVLVRFRLASNVIRVYCRPCGSTAVVTAHAVRGNNNAPQRSILPRHRAGNGPSAPLVIFSSARTRFSGRTTTSVGWQIHK